jgi:hypothetical protein
MLAARVQRRSRRPPPKKQRACGARAVARLGACILHFRRVHSFELPTAHFDAEVNQWRHFTALFKRRFLMAKRDRKLWTWTVLYPFLIMIAGASAGAAAGRAALVLTCASAGIGLLKLGVGLTFPKTNLNTGTPPRSLARPLAGKRSRW